MKAKRAAKQFRERRHSGSLRERAIAALVATWGAIAYDTLQGIAAARAGYPTTEPSVEATMQVTLSGDEVAGSVTSCGFATGFPADYGDDPEAVEWLEGLPFDEQDAIVAEAFPPEQRFGY